MTTQGSIRPAHPSRDEARTGSRLAPWLFAVGLIGVGAGLRVLLRDLPNFAPVAALALFAGYYFRSLLPALCVPLGVMATSDLVLGGYDWRMMAVVYGMLALPVFLRSPLRRYLRLEPGSMRGTSVATTGLLGCSLASSVLFFLVTNFACWLSMGLYAQDLQGLLHCYQQALPFFRYTLCGDLMFATILFGGYAWAVSAGLSAAAREESSTAALENAGPLAR